MSKELEEFSKKVYDKIAILSPKEAAFDITLIILICSVVIDIIKIIYRIYITKDPLKVYNHMKEPRGIIRHLFMRQLRKKIPNLSRDQRELVLVAITSEVRAYGYDEFAKLISSIEKEQ